VGREQRHGAVSLPAVLLFRWLGVAGSAVFMGLWLVAMAAGFAVSLRASLAGERREIAAAWLLVGVLALLVADGPVAWDMGNMNSNLICLGLVMGGYGLARRRPWLGGLLVGLSAAIKLYSGLLLPWMLVTGARRAFIGALAVVILLTLLWPLATWGPDGTVRVYAGFLEQLRIVADPRVHAALAAGVGTPLVTLDRAAMMLTGEGPLGAGTRLLVGAWEALWIAALLWYAWRACRAWRAALPSRAALADWAVLLLAPMPFNPWLEPTHGVPMLVGAILLVVLALDDRMPAPDRRIAAGAFILLLAARAIGLPFGLRGLLLLGRFLVIVLALGLVRPRLSDATGDAQPAKDPGLAQAAASGVSS